MATVLEISEVQDYDDFVYDLEVDTHHHFSIYFDDSPYQLVVHNTDSNFYKTDEFVYNPHDPIEIQQENIATCFEIMKEIGKRIDTAVAGTHGTLFGKPVHKFAPEKIYWPMLLINKKRYVGKKWEPGIDHPSRHQSGIQTKRRDYCELVRNTFNKVIDTIMDSNDPEQEVVKIFSDAFDTLIKGKGFVPDEKGIIPLQPEPLDYTKLIITKNLKEKYDNPSGTAHFVLQQRLEKEYGLTIPSGTRIPYIIVWRNFKEKGITEIDWVGPNYKYTEASLPNKIEYAPFVLENKIKYIPDAAFYIEKQFKIGAFQFVDCLHRDAYKYHKKTEDEWEKDDKGNYYLLKERNEEDWSENVDTKIAGNDTNDPLMNYKGKEVRGSVWIDSHIRLFYERMAKKQGEACGLANWANFKSDDKTEMKLIESKQKKTKNSESAQKNTLHDFFSGVKS